MRLIVSVVARNQGVVLCRARIPAQYPVASGGVAPSVLSVEIGAQASAVLEPPATAASGDGAAEAESRAGFLVSVRRVAFHCQTLPTETSLLVRAQSTGQAGPLQMVRFELIRENDEDEAPAMDDSNGVRQQLLEHGLPAEELLAVGTLGTFQGERAILD